MGHLVRRLNSLLGGGGIHYLETMEKVEKIRSFLPLGSLDLSNFCYLIFFRDRNFCVEIVYLERLISKSNVGTLNFQLCKVNPAEYDAHRISSRNWINP